MKQSPMFQLNWNDLLKGLIMAVLTPMALLVEQTIETGSMTFNWHSIAIAGAAGFMAYIIKNFLTPSAPTQTTTTTPDGTVTEKVINTDSVAVKVDSIK